MHVTYVGPLLPFLSLSEGPREAFVDTMPEGKDGEDVAVTLKGGTKNHPLGHVRTLLRAYSWLGVTPLTPGSRRTAKNVAFGLARTFVALALLTLWACVEIGEASMIDDASE